MAQSLKQLLAHLVFSTKNRHPYLKPAILPRVHGYMSEIIRDVGSQHVVVGGVADHVHLLFEIAVAVPPIKFVSKVKRESSKFVKTLGRAYREFAWQNGYGLFSVSPTHRDAVEEYVRRQEDHHRRVSFEEEFVAMLRKQGIEFDERYVWD